MASAFEKVLGVHVRFRVSRAWQHSRVRSETVGSSRLAIHPDGMVGSCRRGASHDSGALLSLLQRSPAPSHCHEVFCWEETLPRCTSME